jgi:hypothetical protein
MCLTQSACEPEAKQVPAPLDPRIETAVVDARAAADAAKQSSLLAAQSATTAGVSVKQCIELAELQAKGRKRR